MDHTNHVRLGNDELTAAVLEGATIYGPDDENIGTVSEVLPTGSVAVDVGGFLGIGAKSVAVPASQLEFMRDEDGEVDAVTTGTEEQLKAMADNA